MDLNLFFTPVEEALFEKITSVSAFAKSININSSKMPQINGHELAIIGVTEARGNEEA